MLLPLNILKQIKAGLSIVNSNFSASSFLFTFTINKKFSSSSNRDNGEEDNKSVEKTISSQELHNNANIVQLNKNNSINNTQQEQQLDSDQTEDNDNTDIDNKNKIINSFFFYQIKNFKIKLIIVIMALKFFVKIIII